mgnify:CR=1 FL=1
MDFRLIRRLGHFLAVAEEGHFGRAAARLGISQPPLTAQIQLLEKELGVKLLERSGKGARPTREGEALLPLARRIAGNAADLESLARELRMGHHAPVSIACVTSALFDYLPPIVRAMQAARPEAAIGVREMDTRDRGYLSGAVAHGPVVGANVSVYGPTPQPVALLDGLLLAANGMRLKTSGVRFDTALAFLLYDLDFCRSARQAGLTLGTWPIAVTHTSSGDSLRSEPWQAACAHYLRKWA